MSGGLFMNQLLRETGLEIDADAHRAAAHAPRRGLHAAAPAQIRPLPGARELLATLTDARHPLGDRHQRPHGDRRGRSSRRSASIPTTTPVVTRDQVRYAKPDPDLFLAAAARLGAPIETAIVVGDSVWDMLAARRCRALGIGLLSGGYGEEELRRAGAYPRVRGSRRPARATSTRSAAAADPPACARRRRAPNHAPRRAPGDRR